MNDVEPDGPFKADFETEILKLRLEHQTRRDEAKAGVLKTVYGTALVGVAVAFFPFA